MIKFIPPFLLITFSLIACKSDDVSDLDDLLNDDDDLKGAHVTAKVNGDQFTSADDALRATFEETDMYFTLAFGAVSVSSGKARGIALGVAGLSSEPLEVGATFTNEETDEGIGVEAAYSEGPVNDADADVSTDELLEISIKLTAIDRDNKTISGEFNFKALDEESNKTYTITEGMFSEIPY